MPHNHRAVSNHPSNTAGGNVRPGTVTIQRGSFFPAIAPNELRRNVLGIRCAPPVAKGNQLPAGSQRRHNDSTSFGDLIYQLCLQYLLCRYAFFDLAVYRPQDAVFVPILRRGGSFHARSKCPVSRGTTSPETLRLLLSRPRHCENPLELDSMQYRKP